MKLTFGVAAKGTVSQLAVVLAIQLIYRYSCCYFDDTQVYSIYTGLSAVGDIH